MRKFLLILGLGAAFLSCEQRPVVTFVPVPLVTSLLADTTVSAWSPLAAYDAEDSRGSIAVIGEPDRVSWMMGTLLLQDSFDNIDGRLLSDGLPDFAGETLAAQRSGCRWRLWIRCITGTFSITRTCFRKSVPRCWCSLRHTWPVTVRMT